MSTTYNTALIYGFKAPSLVAQNTKTREKQPAVEWLSVHFPGLQCHSHGDARKGDEVHFVGAVIAEVHDVTGGKPAASVCLPTDAPPQAFSVYSAHQRLSGLGACGPIGFWLVGCAV